MGLFGMLGSAHIKGVVIGPGSSLTAYQVVGEIAGSVDRIGGATIIKDCRNEPYITAPYTQDVGILGNTITGNIYIRRTGNLGNIRVESKYYGGEIIELTIRAANNVVIEDAYNMGLVSNKEGNKSVDSLVRTHMSDGLSIRNTYDASSTVNKTVSISGSGLNYSMSNSYYDSGGGDTASSNALMGLSTAKMKSQEAVSKLKNARIGGGRV